MATTAERRYAGRWYTRRVLLEPGETVTFSTSALELFDWWVGSPQPGVLYLTDARLIFTPMGWPLSWKRIVHRAHISNVELSEVRWLGIGKPYWVLSLDTERRRLRFAFFGGLENQRKQAHDWLKAIEQWNN